jgi:SAM-dependent methyltransferase
VEANDVKSDMSLEKPTGIRLNLGCGDNIVHGYINHDMFRHRPEVDVAHDLQVCPWPWADDSVEEILLLDVLEHLPDVVPIIDECWRVLIPGGALNISVPHFEADHAWLDPTHRRGFHLDSFDYFDPHTPWGSAYPFYTQRKWRLTHKELASGSVIVEMRAAKDDPLESQNESTSNHVAGWLLQLHLATAEITALVPIGEKVILVDESQFGRWVAPGRNVTPFLERGGEYWGPPADDAEGIRELGRLREGGASFLIFGWPAFWWLEYYGALHRHLRSHFRCALENDRLVAFDLRRQPEG